MANSDETSARFANEISCSCTSEPLEYKFNVPLACGNIFSTRWYLPNGRYPIRDGNVFKPYFSGKEVFEAIASSIEKAKRSIDIVTWGFDPAMPLKRDGDQYQQSYKALRESFLNRWWSDKRKNPLLGVDRDRLKEDERKAILALEYMLYSGWQREDSYGELLLNALKRDALKKPEEPKLNIRIVLWRMPLNANWVHPFVQNATGISPWEKDQNIPRKELYTGFEAQNEEDEKRKEEYNIPKNSLDLSKIMMRDRHPDAQDYSSEWFHRLVYEQVASGEDNIFDRIAVVFRNPPVITDLPEEDPPYGAEGDLLRRACADHQKCVLIDIDDDGPNADPHGYVMGHNSMTNYWSEFPFVHRDPCNEMDYRPYHDFSMLVRGPLLIDLSKNFCDAWGRNRTAELDKSYVYSPGKEKKVRTLEKIAPNTLADNPLPRKLYEEPGEQLGVDREKLYSALEQKNIGGSARGQIVRTRVDEEIDGFREKEIKDAYMQATRMSRNYMFIVNQYLQYAKLFRHVKYWWIKYKDDRQMALNPIPDDEGLYIFLGTARPEREDAIWRAHQMANELGCGDQFSYTEDQMYVDLKEGKALAKNSEISTIKDNRSALDQHNAKVQEKTLSNYRRVLRDAGFTEEQIQEAEKEDAKQLKLYPKNKDGKDSREPTIEERLEEGGNKVRTSLGSKMSSAVQVPKSEIDEYQIKPLFFMFYTKIKGGNLPENNHAQQPYVHAKLFVQDDTFFTLGSANLNARSMSADSELNLISDDMETAIKFRQHLWEKYTGYPGEAIEIFKLKCQKTQQPFTNEKEMEIKAMFPNEAHELGQIELGKVYKTFQNVLDLNHIRLSKKEPIQGCIAKFKDIRPGDAMRKA